MSTLLRVLGVGFGLAVTVGNTVGAGILRTPGEVAAQLPSTGPFLAAWLAGGLYALLGALVLSEVGAMLPRSGGYYVFAHRAFGPFAAFVVGWTDWLAQSGTIATASILVGDYGAQLLPALAGHQTAVALATAVGLALLQARGVRWGALAQGVSSSLKGLALLGVVAAFVVAYLATGGAAAPAAPAAPAGAVAAGAAAAGTAVGVAGAGALAVAVLRALQAVIYTYDGWYGVIYFGEEVRQPGRDVPRAMVGGVLLVMGLYLAVNAALVLVLPPARMAGEPLAVGAAVGLVFGAQGALVTQLLAIICLVSGINAYQLMASRIPLAMCRDGLLPAVCGRVNAGGTPTAGLLLSTGVAVLFIASGTFQRVMALMAFFFVANYVMAFAAVFVLRRREPAAPRPYRAWGHPVTTGAALAVSVLFLAGAVAGDTRNSLYALLVLAASYPVYVLTRGLSRRWQRGTPADTTANRR
jgi:basic amino acid/polyamine antiporter, APA family